MNLVDYGRILMRRGWILLLLAAIAASSAYILSKQETPVYLATQKMLLVPSRTDLGITEAAVRLLSLHAAYLDSQQVAQQVINNLQLDMTPAQLISDVTIAPKTDSLLIQIDVKNTDPKVASDIARAWGDMLVQFRNDENQKARQEDRIEARPQDDPQISLVSPRPTINVLVGAVLGLLVGGIIVFVMEYLESATIRHPEDVERMVNLPVLASMPDIE